MIVAVLPALRWKPVVAVSSSSAVVKLTVAAVAKVEVKSCFEEPEYVPAKVPDGIVTTALISAKVPYVVAGVNVPAGELDVAVAAIVKGPPVTVPLVAVKVTVETAPGATALPYVSAMAATRAVSAAVR